MSQDPYPQKCHKTRNLKNVTRPAPSKMSQDPYPQKCHKTRTLENVTRPAPSHQGLQTAAMTRHSMELTWHRLFLGEQPRTLLGLCCEETPDGLSGWAVCRLPEPPPTPRTARTGTCKKDEGLDFNASAETRSP